MKEGGHQEHKPQVSKKVAFACAVSTDEGLKGSRWVQPPTAGGRKDKDGREAKEDAAAEG